MGDFNYVPMVRELVEVLKDIHLELKGIHEELTLARKDLEIAVLGKGTKDAKL